MEPVTHLLTGACLGRSGFNRRTALATATMVLAAEIPDLDVVWYFKDPIEGFSKHRGFSHSFAGVPVDAALVLGVIYLYWQWHGRKRMQKKLAGREPERWETPRWGLLYALACLAALSHLLLDFTNNYGLRPFIPFSYKWYAWDTVAIVEPLMLAALIAGLAAPALFRLVSDEVASRRSGGRRMPAGRGGPIFALVFLVALWGFRDLQHRRAVGALQEFEYRGQPPLQAGAFPVMIDPFHWKGVVETKDFFAAMPVDSSTPEVDPNGEMQIQYKPPETPVTLAAKKSFAGRVFLSWARDPMVEVEEHPLNPNDMYTVRFYDVRYAALNGNRHPLGVTVELDKNLRVVDEYMSARGR